MAKPSKLIIASILIFTAALLLYGCGSESDNGVGGDSVDIKKVGTDTCYKCHSDAVNPVDNVIFGDSEASKAAVKGWLNGPHGNYESYDSDLHEKKSLGAENTGFPFYEYFVDANGDPDPTCPTCHDRLGDGKMFETFFAETGVDAVGKVNRPVIGCESCHGGGGNHNGMGPLEYGTPDDSRCGQCHNDAFPDGHLPYHPEGDKILEEYRESPHAVSLAADTYVDTDKTAVDSECSQCHTDEGARKYIRQINGTATFSEIVNFMGEEPDITDPSNVQCRTCHDGHDPHKLLGENAVGLPDTWSAEFKTCTTCHQLLKTDGTALTNSYHDPSVNPNDTNTDNVITDSHYALPGDFSGARGGNVADISGYALDISDVRVCRNCHNPHNADTTINGQWAQSAHADKTAAGAWAHYNWTNDNTGDQDGDGNPDGDRRACQRCHTTTGFIALTDAIFNQTTFDPISNPPLAFNPQFKPEMLLCKGCHTSNTGNLRDKVTLPDGTRSLSFEPLPDYFFPAGRSIPDVAASNICVNCHSGRQTGQSITGSADDFGNKSLVQSHYLSAAGVLFRTIGYEYDNRGYEDPFLFLHGRIGSADTPGTGEKGPCIGCHMRTEESHLLHPVKKDASGDIIEITANDLACSTCHTDQNVFTPANLNKRRKGYENALDALKDALEAKGFNFVGGYPYFSNTDWITPEDTTGKNNMGAAFNYNTLHHEPGAYAHNGLYAKRLIFDSIDFLDDGVLNGAVDLSRNLFTGAAPGYPEAAEWYQHDGDNPADDAFVTRP